MAASTRWLVVIAVVITLAVAASIMVAILAGGEDEFSPDSPEAAVQRYLRAVADRDASLAFSMVSAEVAERCQATPRDPIMHRGESDFRAVIEERRERDGVTEIRVELTQRTGNEPFGGNEWSHTETFTLQREGGEWRFVEAPWPLFCGPRAIPTVVVTPRPAP